MKKKKKPKKKKKSEKKSFFVGLQDPVSIRRNVLLSSKNLIDCLKKYEGLIDLRLRKQNYVVEFKRVVDELLILNRKLRSHLPKTHLREKEVPMKTKVTPHASHRSHLAILESELARVESKLDHLE